MGSISDELASLVTALEAEGIRTTDDPDLILGLLSEHGCAALVGPPETRLIYLSGAEVVADVPVHLAGNPPGGKSSWLPVWAAQPAAMRVCVSVARPVSLTIGDLSLPAVRLTAQRSFIASELKRS